MKTLTKRIRTTKQARLIRIGINSQCLPYVLQRNASVLDFPRLWKFTLDWEETGTRSALAKTAAARTGRHTRTWTYDYH